MYCVGISKIKKKESYLCESCKEKNSRAQAQETNLNGENLKEKQLPASDMTVWIIFFFQIKFHCENVHIFNLN